MILIVRKDDDNLKSIIAEQEEKGNSLVSLVSEEGIATMKFSEPDEAKPPTLEGVKNELTETKNELSSTQIALSDVYEQLVLLQDQLNSLKGGTNNG